LIQFEGAILLVSQDRYFLDQVSTQLLAFPVTPEDKKRGELFTFADLSQWESWHAESLEQISENAKKGASEKKEPQVSTPKNSSSSKREAEMLLKLIEKAENSLAALAAQCEEPDVLSDLKKLSEVGVQMTKLQADIDSLYKKWNLLESKK
jgi:ATP-binding cassette subfamily F protein uup